MKSKRAVSPQPSGSSDALHNNETSNNTPTPVQSDTAASATVASAPPKKARAGRYTPQQRDEIIAALNAVPEKVCPYLFPEGELKNGCLCVGSIKGKPGVSLKINVSGEKVGWWKDWAEEGVGGKNFVDLRAKVRQLPFHKALAEAKAWLDANGDDGSAAAPVPATPKKPTPSPGAVAKAKAEKPFDWAKCVEKSTSRHLEYVRKERGFSEAFVWWLHRKQLIGFYGGKVAFPIHNEEGVVVGIHARDKNRNWQVAGGCRMHPLIIGNLATAKTVLIFESQWDALAVMDKLWQWDGEDEPSELNDTGIIVTRGAMNGNFINGRIPTGAAVYAFKQNDEPDAQGRSPADDWLEAVARHGGTGVLLVTTPLPHKDMNDCTRDGAGKEAIEQMINAATVVPVPEPKPAAPPPPTAQPPERQPTPAAALVAADELPGCYYEPSQQKCWFMPNRSGGHVGVNDAGLRRYLKSLDFSSDTPDGAFISPLDSVLLRLQQDHELAYAGPLAGYDAGIHRVQNTNVLVTTSPTIIKPMHGVWPVLGKLFETMLVDGKLPQQATFFGWTKVGFQALINRERRPGQGLVLAGPAGCGKSLLQNVLTFAFGGRSAKPYQYMTGGTGFNRGLFTGEHLMVENDVPSADYRSRRNFGTHIKGITVNATQRLHQKFRDAIILEPFWRLTISVNDEPENLMVLPPIDESIGDKFILLRAKKGPMPMPTNTDAQRREFWETLMAELPAFLFWLSEWEIPEGLRDERYGVAAFHYPELLRAIDDLAPETRMLGLIDDELFVLGPDSAAPWTGTARKLEKKLVEADFASAREARRLFSFNTACGTYLARLEQKFPKRVSSRTKKGYRFWTITPPDELPDVDETAEEGPSAND